MFRRGGLFIKLFLSKRTSSDTVALVSDSLYLGIEIALDEENAIYMYFLRDNARSAYLLACFDDVFDSLSIHTHDYRSLKIRCNSWPIITELVTNGLKDQCKDYALIRIRDLDDGETKWFLSARINDIDLNTAEELFCEKTIDAIEELLKTIVQLIKEVSGNRPSLFPKYAKKAFRRYVTGMLTSLLGTQ